MNVEIGNEVVEFHFCEYINRIFGTVQAKTGRQRERSSYHCRALLAICTVYQLLMWERMLGCAMCICTYIIIYIYICESRRTDMCVPHSNGGLNNQSHKTVMYKGNLSWARIFKLLREPKNRFQGIDSASLCSLVGRYDNPKHTRFLAPIDSLKIPALYSL